MASIAVSARFSNRRAALSGLVAAEHFRLVPDGTIDLAANRFDRFRLALALPGAVSLADNLEGAGLSANLVLDGTLAAPDIAYRLSARNLAGNGVSLDDVTASGTARAAGGQWLVPVTARARRISGLDAVSGGTLANVTLTGDLAARWPRILSDNLRIRSDRIDAGVILAADLGKGSHHRLHVG